MDAIAYSVVAERDSDSERSNFCGKSYLLEAIPFALYGVHRHRLEEGWISKGEKEGGVDVTLSDNTLISRYRKPGAGTQIEVTLGTGLNYRGAEAQKVLEHHLGLGLEDFRTTSWLAQGEAAAIVRGDPATRTAMVSRWLGIERLEWALAGARKRVNGVGAEVEKSRGRLVVQRERLARTRLEHPLEAVATLKSAEESLAEWEELLVLANEEEAGKRLAAERAKVEAEVSRLADELASAVATAWGEDESQNVLTSAKANRDGARERYQAARVKRANRISVASGTFNGRCPVAGIDCPAKEQINALGEEADEEAERAEQEYQAAHTAAAAAEAALRLVEQGTAERRAMQTRLDALQERLDAMTPVGGPAPSSGLVLGAVRAQRDAVAAEIAGLRRDIRECEEASAEIETLAVTERSHLAGLATAREGAALLARAPRRLAERVLGLVARDANRILAEAGVELSLAIQWEREGRDPADACEACGAAFPRSAKVKACESCQEPRGLKRVRRLDVELSARSGAAEDLAGLALSLSAGSWLRGERGSSFGLLLGDELSAQLDKSHRRMMSAHLPRMLRAARVEQALLVSHDVSSVASCEGRIAITSDGTWARVSVE